MAVSRVCIIWSIIGQIMYDLPINPRCQQEFEDFVKTMKLQRFMFHLFLQLQARTRVPDSDYPRIDLNYHLLYMADYCNNIGDTENNVVKGEISIYCTFTSIQMKISMNMKQ